MKSFLPYVPISIGGALIGSACAQGFTWQLVSATVGTILVLIGAKRV